MRKFVKIEYAVSVATEKLVTLGEAVAARMQQDDYEPSRATVVQELLLSPPGTILDGDNNYSRIVIQGAPDWHARNATKRSALVTFLQNAVLGNKEELQNAWYARRDFDVELRFVAYSIDRAKTSQSVSSDFYTRIGLLEALYTLCELAQSELLCELFSKMLEALRACQGADSTMRSLAGIREARWAVATEHELCRLWMAGTEELATRS